MANGGNTRKCFTGGCTETTFAGFSIKGGGGKAEASFGLLFGCAYIKEILEREERALRQNRAGFRL